MIEGETTTLLADIDYQSTINDLDNDENTTILAVENTTIPAENDDDEQEDDFGMGR